MQTVANIGNVLHAYSITNNAELEIRFDSKYIKKDWYMSLLTEGIKRGTAVFDQTINLISDIVDGYNAQQITFVDGVKQSDATIQYTKKQIVRTQQINGLVPYRLTLSTENQTNASGVPNLARIKLRLSIHKYPKLEDWRIDFTFVKQLNVVKSQLISYRDKMFIKYDLNKFVDQAPWLFADKYELEIEHIGKTKTGITEANIQNVIEIIYGMVSPNHKQIEGYQNAIHTAAQLIMPPQKAELFRMRNGLKKLFNAVKEMNRLNYFTDIFPKIQQYYATIKADGYRALVHAHSNNVKVIGHELTTFTLNTALKHDIVADAEVVNNRPMIFDVMYVGGVNISQKPFSERIKFIKDVVLLLEKHVVPKKYIKLTNTWAVDLKEMWEEKYDHGVDGIIFNAESGSYENMEVWKWKPIDKMSVDFMVMNTPDELIGTDIYNRIPNHTLMLLFCSIRGGQFKSLHIRKLPFYDKIFPNQANHDIFPIQFTTPDNPTAYLYHHPDDSKIHASELHGRISEFNYTDNKWSIMRIREDRDVDIKQGTYFGNNYHVAMVIWNNYSNPLLFSDIITPTPNKMGYFITHDSSAHKAIRNFHSFIKSKVMGSFFKGSKWLVDLGGGKGQDMFRYSKIGIAEALIIDSDREALTLVQSKMFSHKKSVGIYRTRLLTKLMDLNEPYLDNIKRLNTIIPNDGVPSVMCNFAIHYFMATKVTARNLINMVNALIGKTANRPGGGTFMFVCLNGKRVFELLQSKKEGQSVDYVDNGLTKFSIKRMYTSNQFMEVGQKIGMVLPFSDQKYYEEYLVNVDYIIGIFKNMGYTVLLNKSFDYWLDMATIESSSTVTNMTDTDKRYTVLHQVVVVNKTQITSVRKTKIEEKKLFEQGLGTFSDMSTVLPQKHKSQLISRWFDLIQSGRKTVEGRLNKGTFAKVNPGDIIEFTKTGTQQTIIVKVVDIKKYATFEEMFGNGGETVESALPGIESVTNAVELYHKIYPPELTKKHGVIAVHIQLIGVYGSGDDELKSDTISIITKICNMCKYKQLFVKLFLEGLHKTIDPIETVDDIKYEFPYNQDSIIRPSRHIGQRKLFLSEVQFLNDNNSGICLYAGAAPGNKTHYLSELFPNVKFILIDPNKFNLIVPPHNNSHRLQKHDDIVHIYSNYATKSNIYKINKTVSEMSDNEKNELLQFITDSKYKIFIIEDYMDAIYAKLFKDLNVTFISDIRSNSSDDGYPMDIDIYWNISMMFNWIQVMKPSESMLKHRMPFGSDASKPMIVNERYQESFDQSRAFGIDFYNDYKNDKMRMCHAKLYIQAWSPISSTELRMRVTRADLNNIVEYDVKAIESKLCYYNNINRSYVYHTNNNASEELNFCHCNDCALENKILSEYVSRNNTNARVTDIVKKLGTVTHRPLISVHKVNIWKPLDTTYLKTYVDAAILEYSNNRRLTSDRSKNYKKSKGDTGSNIK